MWQDLTGKTKRFAGSSGTVTVPAGCKIIMATAHASASSATMTLPQTDTGGDVTVPIPNGGQFSYAPNHLLCVVQKVAYAIVFTNTDGYVVEIYSERGLF